MRYLLCSILLWKHLRNWSWNSLGSIATTCPCALHYFKASLFCKSRNFGVEYSVTQYLARLGLYKAETVKNIFLGLLQKENIYQYSLSPIGCSVWFSAYFCLAAFNTIETKAFIELYIALNLIWSYLKMWNLLNWSWICSFCLVT